ncbi:fumarylacetoacetate hydrolase family protein [Actinomadura sp. 9N215]|uniref:fumarylacetoacetate hydrolase family protein n=1 Tax=Actinomadura sp. 9N215 TaxID=3375150 RepID=UPI00378BFC76
MKLGRITTPDGPEFAVRTRDDEGWTTLRSLGVHASTTSEAIAAWPRITGRPPAPGENGRETTPVVAPSKILAIGLNYADHVAETGKTATDPPTVFAKFPSSLNGPYDDILLDPALTSELDYEVELAVVIGATARRLTPDTALTCVFGYAVGNDVSARDRQVRPGQLSVSKSLDTFCPIGPWITTADEIPDPQRLGIRSSVNGEPRQDSTTAAMLFPVADLLVRLSATMTLRPGDVLLTGTPAGVGWAADPPGFLRPGDIVTCEIDGLGHIANRVVLDPAADR